MRAVTSWLAERVSRIETRKSASVVPVNVAPLPPASPTTWSVSAVAAGLHCGSVLVLSQPLLTTPSQLAAPMLQTGVHTPVVQLLVPRVATHTVPQEPQFAS